MEVKLPVGRVNLKFIKGTEAYQKDFTIKEGDNGAPVLTLKKLKRAVASPARRAPPAPPPAQQTAKPKTAGGTGTIFISSVPPRADIYYKGKKIGRSNVDKLTLPVGRAVLTFKKGSLEKEIEYFIEAGRNKSPLIRLQ